MLLSDRVSGCLLGGALGDAWGGPFEGQPGPVCFAIPDQSHLSDDTQLTLATCEAILEDERVEPESIARNFGAWYRQGRVQGMGSSTLKALIELASGGHWALSGAKGEYSAGSGAAMRAAPLAFVLDPRKQDHRRTLRDICRITHHNDEAYVGALAIVLAIRKILSAEWPNQHSVIKAIISELPDSAVRDRLRDLDNCGQETAEMAARFGATGHVVDSVPLAIHAAQSIQTLPIDSVIQGAIRGGGDTDTIAAMAGQIAGCVSGFSGISEAYLNSITGIAATKAIVLEFANFVELEFKGQHPTA